MGHLAAKTVDRILSTVCGNRLKTPTPEESARIRKLRATLQEMRPARSVDDSLAAVAWDKNTEHLRTCALQDDPRSFLSWPVIQSTMAVRTGRTAWTELAALRRRQGWHDRWSKAIVETSMGCPQPFVLYPKSSGNLIHHAYHLAQFEDRMGIDVSKFSAILEFGGGYGSMCRLFHNLGFDGSYIIFDLPAFSALQEYYLTSIGICVGGDCLDRGSVNCLHDIEQLERATGVLRTIGNRPSLFIATWSLSETPIALRDQIVPLISEFDALLIAYQAEFGEIDSLKYFDGIRERFPQVQWQNWEIVHMPGNYYLMGARTAMADEVTQNRQTN
jgi:hypothetical protein